MFGSFLVPSLWFLLFFSAENTATFGYPDDNQAQAYCSSFRMSIIAITLMAVAMHGIAIACAVCLTNNAREGRESLVHEVSLVLHVLYFHCEC